MKMELIEKLKSLGKKKLAIISGGVVIVVAGIITGTVLLLNNPGNQVLPTSEVVTNTASGQLRTKIDSPVLEEETRKTFDFFWKEANTDKNSKGYGLVVDRVTNKDMASVASVGYALAAYGIGSERGYITRAEAEERALGTINTLLNNVEGKNGFLYHFVDMKTGKRYGNCEVSIIDTSICLNGVIFAGEYFGGEVKKKADEFYAKIDWPWYFNQQTQRFYMSYKPEDGLTGEWNVSAEQFMVYFYSSASPTHPVPGTAFDNFDRLGVNWAGYPAYLTAPANSLFTHQYSEAWFDLSNKVDRSGFDWYRNSRIATLANRQFSVDNMNLFKTFGPDVWGLTACDGPNGYNGGFGANPTAINDGTVSPSAPAGSVPFAPRQTVKALEKMKTIKGLFNDYGFQDSFNLESDVPWIDKDVLGIDKGISMLMIENYRTGLVWKTMEKNKSVINGMKESGFVPADTIMIDDADGNTSHEDWATNGAYTVKSTNDAALGNKALEVSFDKTGKKDAALTADITALKIDPDKAGILKMQVKGTGSISLTLTSRSGGDIGTTKAVTFKSDDKYQQIVFDLTDFKKTITTLKSISIHVNPGEESKGKLLMDEIQIAPALPEARAIIIDDRPYLGSTVSAEFDFFDALGRAEGPCYYQWYSSDDANGDFTPIKDATSLVYKVTDGVVKKFLKLQVTPTTKDGIKGAPAFSNVSSCVTEKSPIAPSDIQDIIKQNKGKTPDVITGDTFNVNNKWVDGGDKVYKITESETLTKADFDKGKSPWSFMKRDITVRDISKFNCLSMSFKGDADFLVLKFESAEGTPIGEIKIKIDPSQSSTYDWDLTSIKSQLKNVGRLLIFAAPGAEGVQGSLSCDKLVMTVAKAKTNIIKAGQTSNDINLKTNVYTGDNKDFSFNNSWVDGADGVYNPMRNSDGTWKISYNKDGKPDWAYMKSPVSGRLSDFKKVVLTVQGKKGTHILYKVEAPDINNPKNKWSKESEGTTLTGGTDTIEINLKDIPAAQLNKINNIILFAEYGKTSGSGTFTIKEAYFSTERSTVVEKVSVYNGDKKDFHFNQYWFDNGKDDVYTVSYSNGVAVVKYNKRAGKEWAVLASPIKGRFSDFNYATVKIKGQKGETGLIKLQSDSGTTILEQNVTFDGTVQTFTVNFSGKHAMDSALNAMSKFYLFVDPGKANKSGSFEIYDTFFSVNPPSGGQIIEVKTNKYSGNKADFHMNSFWQDNGDGVYSIANASSTNTVSYNKGSMTYPFVKIPVEGRFSDFNYLSFKVKGAAGTKVMFKLEKGDLVKEYNSTLDGTDQMIVLDLSALHASYDSNLNSLDTVMVFVEPGAANKSGSITFNDAWFSVNKPSGGVVENKVNTYSGDKKDFTINQFWRDNGDGVYTISNSGNTNTVNYSKKEFSYPTVQIPVTGKLSDFDYLVFNIHGTASQQVMFKLNKNGINLEKNLILDGTNQTFVIDLKTIKATNSADLDKLDAVLIFAWPGAVEKTGSFTVTNAYFTQNNPVTENVYSGDKNDFLINNLWRETNAGDGVYNISQSGTVTTVTYNKTAGKTNTSFETPVKGKLSDFNFVSLNVQGTAGKKLTLRLQNKGTVLATKEFILDGTAQRLTLDFSAQKSNPSLYDSLTAVSVFMDDGVASSGKVVINDAWFSLNDPGVNTYPGGGNEFKFNNFWRDNGDNVYTISNSNGVNTVNYNKAAGNEWSTAAAPVSGKFSDFNFIVFKVKGTNGQKVLFKLDGLNLECNNTFNGQEQTVVFDLRSLHPANNAQLDSLKKVLIFGAPGTTDSGSFTVSNAYFTNTNPNDINIYNGNKADFAMNDFWRDNGDKVYTITSSSGVNTVNYAKAAGNEWSTAAIPISGRFADFNYVTFVVNGPKDKQVLIKLQKNGLNKEYWHTFSGTTEVVTCDMSALHPANDSDLNALDKVLLFAAPGNTESGSFTVSNAFFSVTKPNVYLGGGTDFHFNSGWYDQDGGKFTITPDGQVVNVVANHAGWSTLRTNLYGKFSDFGCIKIKAKGTAGKKILLKIQNDPMAKEAWCTFDGSEQTFTLDYSDKKPANNSLLDSLKNLMIFYDPENSESATNESFQISDIWFSQNP